MPPTSINQFQSEKVLSSQWQWKYQVTEYNSNFVQRCPTKSHDLNIFYNNKFVGKTFSEQLLQSKKITTFKLTLCNGVMVIYTIKAGSSFNFENKNVSLLIFNGNEEISSNLLAYSDPFNFFSNNIILKNGISTTKISSPININTNSSSSFFEGAEISQIQRLFLPLETWIWQYTVYDSQHPVNNHILLLALTGKLSFSDNPSHTDACNNYFWTVSWIVLSFALSVILYILAKLIFSRLKMQSRRLRRRNDNDFVYQL